jgi:hydrogenase maturation protein HypF
VVQGVGFRPFVHRLALRHGLAGWVRNAAGDVRIAVEGPAEAVAAFAAALRAEAPPLARLERVEMEPRAVEGLTAFAIAPSLVSEDGRQPVSPDVAICAACERELFDPADRRHRYPFITCTDCGPRFSVIESMPYDRERTSMRIFRQCPACLAEYRQPGHRRYHSETNSCAQCGPRVWLEEAGTEVRGHGGTEGDAAIVAAAGALREGRIVAVRGLGGYHLACDATSDAAVRRLRERKRREAKPLAVMVRDLAAVRALVEVDDRAAALLDSPEKPIVVLPRRPDAPLAPAVAPGLASVGVMLAYTPLHLLLLEAVGRPLVMTSGNLSDEPIATANDDARRRLGGIADLFLMHDREILSRYDDSVIRAEGPHIVLRRARGFAPMPLPLPQPVPRPLLAVGPHLKNTLTLAVGDRAFVSQHVGDLEDLDTLEHWRAIYDVYRRLFRIEPELVVRDLHPGYLSTRVAQELGLPEAPPVQHHHAHVAAVLAEHGRTERAVGVAFDGTGYGDDGRTWGAEILVADLAGYRRRAQLRYAPLPGGDLAARRPWRAALGYLSLEPAAAGDFALAFRGVPEEERRIAEQQVARRLNAPLASSMGRLFDAAAAVLGVRHVSDYEGQAAMELEALAGRRPAAALPLAAEAGGEGNWVWDPVPLLAALGSRRRAGADAADLAAAFHESVAETTAGTVARLAADEGLRCVALGGGVFQNARLLEGVVSRLAARGLEVLVPRRLSPNDGAISYGQAAVASALPAH